MNYQPLSTNNDTGTNYNQVNDMVRQLNKEQTTKVFKQSGGYSIIEGKLPYDGGYGSLYYDSNNVPSIVIGILPDGTVGMAIAKAGIDVLSAFS